MRSERILWWSLIMLAMLVVILSIKSCVAQADTTDAEWQKFYSIVHERTGTTVPDSVIHDTTMANVCQPYIGPDGSQMRVAADLGIPWFRVSEVTMAAMHTGVCY